MKPFLILVSHGQMAAATLGSAEMITGPIADACAVCMSEEDGLGGFSAKLTAAVAQLPADREIVVVADLYGGTPCNVTAATLLGDPRVRLVAGMNLGMVIEFAGCDADNADELADTLAAIGKISVKKVAPVVTSPSDDDDDEIECD